MNDQINDQTSDQTPARFDPIAYRAEQLATWDAGAPAWDRWHDTIETWFAPLTTRLLELAAVRPGQHVLDVGTGYGEPALSAARAVGPGGRVLGIDVSPAMLEVARRRARGRSGIRYAEMDIEALDQPGRFDAVLSRLGLMFAVDRVAALGAIRRALVPGGVLAAAVWGPPARHLVSQPAAQLVARLALPAPPPGTPGPFSMSDATRLAGELAAAGLVDVSVTELVAPVRFRSVDELVRFHREALPPPILAAVRDRFGSQDAPDAWALLAEAARPHVGPDGAVSLPSVALCVRAAAPPMGHPGQ
ncbi:MAG TPA: class I SAM-dependent methyltransferase [Kofleriaceae bacterium]|nr:class I SAM-dependent methyltransferase [Kofleriaceae bacterium]